MRVIKRNGQEVEFDKQKIIDAMTNAFMETEEGIDEDLIQDIADEIEEEIGELVYYPTVESIQDMVEEALMSSDRKDVAKRYILYRDERSKFDKQGPGNGTSRPSYKGSQANRAAERTCCRLVC